ncbi:hypothetical protein NEHOM01_1468 [Nematocida homosporus]|uniref:uncharacterized protein n=1 Tax=Nematocida homosporus TaxID=1912981 RepID=UPI00221F1005|nr:uncharacterized protein NEHOM01_1468 [Nematocida homosporus]KAI5186435.1 hypothetical protein NEHOM01_1468 [Nematocida homosporus]
MERKTISKKNLFMCASVGVLGLLIASGAYVLYQRYSVGEMASQTGTETGEARKPVPFFKILSKDSTDTYTKITPKNVKHLFEKENIIPTRYYGASEVTTKGKEPQKVITAPKKGFFSRITNLGWFKKSSPQVEGGIEALSVAEMGIHLENSRIIERNFKPLVVLKTNQSKTAKKESLIKNLQYLLSKVDVDVFPGKDEIFKKAHYLIWPTIFFGNPTINHWMLYNLTEEELEKANDDVFGFLKMQEHGMANDENLCDIIKGIVATIAKRLNLGGLSERRATIGAKLLEYKENQNLIKHHPEAYETERLLCMLDVITHYVHVLPEARARFNSACWKIETTINHLTLNKSQMTLDSYLALFRDHNNALIAEINTFLRFVADLEQFVHVATFNVHTTSDSQVAKHVSAFNQSVHAYDIQPDTSAVEVTDIIGKALIRYELTLLKYMQLLDLVENTSDVYGFVTAESLNAFQLQELKKIEDTLPKIPEHTDVDVTVTVSQHSTKKDETPAEPSKEAGKEIVIPAAPVAVTATA